MTDLVRVPKILGSDVELGNFIDGAESRSGSGGAASRLLLREIPGIAAGASAGAASWGAASAQDRGRRFLPGNGGCAYIDLDHLELATPEALSAYDHVAHVQAMLRLARGAVHRVNARMPDGYRVRALANCSDGHGHSYGAHLSVLLTRSAWDDIVRRKPHHLACLAAFQASSIVFTGAGKVGSENGRPTADYQLSQRADFLETVLGEQTTFGRPIVNARDEALCGPSWTQDSRDARGPELARLHVICFDATLCQVATLLRAGTMQIVTSMFEAGRVPTPLALDDPLEALQRWSHDPSLRAGARLVSGEAVTAVELQQRFLDEARACDATRGFDGIVPRAGDILALWA
ncbi:MAG: proteasome accessory factor PafA2 family protein, partial [Acidobacteriota bacterium]|nr:proteasome accessory factor PafA2 family protein [Acidobacteriota bacterium]